MPDTIAEIAVNVAVNKTFHYLVPDHLQGRLTTGSRVLVPFGSRQIAGTVVGLPSLAGVTGLRPVIDILDEALAPDLLELGRWMAEYYLHPLGQTIEALVPKALSRTRSRTRKHVRIMAQGGGAERRKGRKQIELLELLVKQGETPLELLSAFSRTTIRSLIDAGLVEIVERELRAETEELDFAPSAPPELMQEQRAAVEAITGCLDAGQFQVFLLHGVTGSGKTEVYLHAIGHLAGTGAGAIVLVPEIALTPQLLSRFRRRFGSRVAVLHSALTDRERADEYRRIRSGQVDVAVGARSAVFAPFARLALIVVDEEHENSYKQDEGLRYHARDVAVMRAKFRGAVTVLGSATPSLESYFNAQSGKYRCLQLANRVDHRPMPEVTIVDARTLPRGHLFSPTLVEETRLRLEKKEQVLLLLNRRGFSSVLICSECGAAIKCPSCSVSLTFHKTEGSLKCHYCGFFMHPPDACPSCRGIGFRMIGSGTQKVEEELQALFPAARMRRMDSDSVRGKDAYDRLLQQVDRREVDILLGTQMIAKGHDFPAVTLVGVVDADVGLNLPDFRAAERTFQLITQAAGRAGRGEIAGEVVIQTMNPNHYSITHSRTHDYEGFYRQEIAFRTQLNYPPAGRIIKVEVKSAGEDSAREAAMTARDRIRSLVQGSEAVLLGPAAAPIARVRGQFRFQLLLVSRKRDLIRHLAAQARSAVEERFSRKCRVIVDVDPVNLM